jgi:hypothetical protein
VKKGVSMEQKDKPPPTNQHYTQVICLQKVIKDGRGMV